MKPAIKVSERSEADERSLVARIGASRFLDALGWPREVRVTRDEAGLLWVSDWSSKLAIVAPERARLYWRGVQRRSRRLCLHHYLGGGVVPLRPGDVFINVGANIGEVATCLAARGARVIAIEPDPAARRCLLANVAGMSVDVLPVAAWKEAGSLTFYLATETADSSAVTPTGHEMKVEAKTLDAIADGVDHVRAIVGDAEGSEPEVLEGATKTLGRTDFVSLDCGYERRGERTLETCEAILKAAGFDIIHREESRRCNLIARNRNARRDRPTI